MRSRELRIAYAECSARMRGGERRGVAVKRSLRLSFSTSTTLGYDNAGQAGDEQGGLRAVNTGTYTCFKVFLVLTNWRKGHHAPW